MKLLALKKERGGWLDAFDIFRASMYFLIDVLRCSWCWLNPDWIVDRHCRIAIDCMYIG